MKNNLIEFRDINIYVDDENNIAIFSKSKNPEFNNDIDSPMYLLSRTPFELLYPYSLEELAKCIKDGICAWDKQEPYIDSKKSIEEYYYNLKGFRSATYKKKLISLGWNDIEGKYVSLYLPFKTKRYYIEAKSTQLSDDADWIDFAKVVMDYINIDVTQLSIYRTYKSKLNL